MNQAARLAAIAVLLCTGCHADGEAGPARRDVAAPTAAELLERIPSLRSGDASVKNFVADGTMDIGASHVRFSLSYAAPNRYALSLWGLDGTPLFIGVDDRVLAYDTPHGRLVFLTGWGCRFVVARQDREHIRWNFDVAMPKDDEPKEPLLELDLRALLADADARVEELDQQQQRYRLTGTVGKNVVSATIDLARPGELEHFEAIEKGGNAPWAVVRRASSNNAAVPDSRFAFPDIARLQQQKEIPFEALGPLQSFRGGFAQLRAVMGWTARSGIADPAQRTDLEPMLGKIDWPMAKASDATFAPKLRALLPPPPGG